MDIGLQANVRILQRVTAMERGAIEGLYSRISLHSIQDLRFLETVAFPKTSHSTTIGNHPCNLLPASPV